MSAAECMAMLCRGERSVFPFLPRSVFAEAEACGELLGGVGGGGVCRWFALS